MKEKIREILRNPYFIITAVYFMAHFFMLILSGCWWDDWTFMTHNLGYIDAVASQSGRPEWNLLIPFCWSLPNNGRFLIFILYYLDTLLVYGILSNSNLLDKEESLMIALLFTVIPANDARILISNFAYTVGLFLFYLTTFLFMKWLNNGKKIGFRVILLIMYFVSFILNSLMAFYFVVILYLLVLELIRNRDERIIRNLLISVKNVILHYPDFCVIPFVYFIFNKTFFPTNGDVFGSYNALTVKTLIKTVLYIPVSFFACISDVLIGLFGRLNWIVLFVIGVFTALMLYLNRSAVNDAGYDVKKASFVFVFGAIALLLGLFPYVAIRGGSIELSGIQGRDAILIPLGVSIVLFSLIGLLGKAQRKLTVGLLVILGIFACSDLYLEWQKDYYYQLSMERLMDNQIIRDNDTFFLADLNESDIKGQRYYSLNTNAYHIFNDQTRFFIPKVSNLGILQSEENLQKTIEALNYAYMMKDYAPEDRNLDALIVYECDLSDLETLAMKYHEMFNREQFQKDIESRGTMSIIEVDDGFTQELIDGYHNNRIRTDEDVLMLLVEYMGGE